MEDSGITHESVERRHECLFGLGEDVLLDEIGDGFPPTHGQHSTPFCVNQDTGFFVEVFQEAAEMGHAFFVFECRSCFAIGSLRLFERRNEEAAELKLLQEGADLLFVSFNLRLGSNVRAVFILR